VPPEIYKQHRARDDLLGIWLYTAEVWGEQQADRYLDQLQAAIERLKGYPAAGLDYGRIRPGYRRLSVARHRIFYTASEVQIDIIRVLHEREDMESHLK
jgi:toxin ParE1/3/4